jgi:protocatechuate 3,4-dioxygenase alpha subunit
VAKLTPAQTIGPFFHEGLNWAIERTAEVGSAETVRVAGRVLDRDGKGVSDALLEIWRPGLTAAGRDAIAGLQRVTTDDDGAFVFFLPRPVHGQLHANVTVFARGLLRGLFTRVYVPAGHDAAAVALPEAVPAARRHTLVARRSAADPDRWDWDVRLSGTDETVFFDL